MAEPTNRTARYRRRKRSLGICVTCVRPAIPGLSMCHVHTVEANVRSVERKKRFRELGLCRDCGRPKTDKSMCLDCRIKYIADRVLGASRRCGLWKELRLQLEGQKFRCAYSGVAIMPGVNGSLDHIVPKSKGGTNEAYNLHWVDLRVNKMKGSMLEDEFVAMCAVIAERAKADV